MLTFDKLHELDCDTLQGILEHHRNTFQLYLKAKDQIINKILWYQEEIEKLSTDETNKIARGLQKKNVNNDFKGYVVPESEEK